MMQRRSARERLAEGAPRAFVLDKDMGAPPMTDAARFAATDSEGRPVVPLSAAQKYHFDTKGRPARSVGVAQGGAYGLQVGAD